MMKKQTFDSLVKQTKKLLRHVREFGVKGTKGHPYLSYFANSFRIKHREINEKDAEEALKALKSDIEKHMVRNAEKEEVKVMKGLIGDSIFTYVVMDSLAATIYHYIEQILKFINRARVRKMLETNKEFHKEILSIIDFWMTEVVSIRKFINASYTEVKGGTEVNLLWTAALRSDKASFTEKWVEKRLLRGLRKAGSKAGHELDVVAKGSGTIKTVKDLEEYEKLLVTNLNKLYKLLGISWKRFNKSFDDLVKLVHNADVRNELPKMDYQQVHTIRALLIDELVVKGFPALRREVKQIEAEVIELRKRAA